MKKFLALLSLIIAGSAIAGWIPESVNTATRTGVYAITNLNTIAKLRPSSVAVKLNVVSTGTLYVAVMRSSAITNLVVSSAFSGVDSVFLGQSNFEGIYLRPGEYLQVWDSVGAALTNVTYVTFEAWKD